MIRAWVFVLDDAGYVVSRRPFALIMWAGDYALMCKEELGLGDRVRMLRTGL